MDKVKSKLPTRQEIFTIFSVAMFISFTWSIYRMFFQVPSWLFTFNLIDILYLTAYVVAFTLVESLFLLGIMILLALIYPTRLFSKKFVSQSSVILLLLTAGALLYQQHVGMLKKWGLIELLLFIFAFAVSLTLIVIFCSFLFDRVSWLKRSVDSFAERLTVFTFIYLPLSVMGCAVVLVRNIIIR